MPLSSLPARRSVALLPPLVECAVRAALQAPGPNRTNFAGAKVVRAVTWRGLRNFAGAMIGWADASFRVVRPYRTVHIGAERGGMTEIRMTEHQAQMTAVVRERVPVRDLPQFFGRALSKAMSAVQAQGRHPVGPPFSLYHGMPTDSVDVEAGFPVDGPITAVDGVTPSSLPAGRVVEATHVGPYDTLPQTYEEIVGHLKEQGLTPSSDMWEVYLSDPEQEPDPATWRTQIFWPVA